MGILIIIQIIIREIGETHNRSKTKSRQTNRNIKIAEFKQYYDINITRCCVWPWTQKEIAVTDSL